MVARFTCFNLVVKFSAVDLINSGVVIYVLWPDILFSTAVRAVVVARLVILGILFLTSFILALRAVVVAKLVILVISFLTSFILALRALLVAKLVLSGILSSISLILAIYRSFLTISFFTISLSLLKSTGVVSSFPISNLPNLLFKLLKPLSTFFS